VTVFSSLLPGFREIRAPLIAGYLWLAVSWLLLSEDVPSRHDHGAFEDLWEIGDAISPIGLAAVASVAAYIVGSLVQALAGLAVQIYRSRQGTEDLYEVRSVIGHLGGESYDPEAWHSVDVLIEIAGLSGRSDIPMFVEIPNLPAARSIIALRDRELDEVRGRLGRAIGAAMARGQDRARIQVRQAGMRTGLASVPRAKEEPGFEELPIPQFSAYADLYRDRSLLRTRLTELAEATGAKVDRLDAEAGFRLAIAPPLLALAVVFTFDVGPLWLLAILLPLALIADGLRLRRASDRELMDALRARSATEELEQITPVFALYRRDADRLAIAIRNADWSRTPPAEDEAEPGSA